MGTVSDPSGAVIVGARITITNRDTGQVMQVVTNSAGVYNSGALLPGNYRIQAAAKGFISIEASASIQIGITTALSFNLQIGKETQVIEVKSSDVRVNTQQATVEGVLGQTLVLSVGCVHQPGSGSKAWKARAKLPSQVE